MNRIQTTEPTVIENRELTPVRARSELAVVDDTDRSDRSARFFARYAPLLLIVVVPLIITAIYLFLIASERYVSEARFIVRSSSGNGVTGVAAMIESQGLSRANDETYAVNDYLVSRDIVELLVENDHLRDVLARPGADFINRYPNFYTRDNKENLFERYKTMVTARIDGATGISTVRVVAFRGEDARAIAAAVLQYAEELINRLNQRTFDDAERYAQSIVDREKSNIAQIEANLAAYRNASGSVDPGAESVAGFEMIGKMTTEVALLRATLQQQVALAPASPGIAALRARIRSYQAEIDKQRLEIVGSNRSLAAKLAEYEKLELDRELAARALGLAMVSLANARQEAHQQHLYLQTIVQPNLADEAEYPRQVIAILIAFVVFLGLYATLRTLRLITLEHRP